MVIAASSAWGTSSPPAIASRILRIAPPGAPHSVTNDQHRALGSGDDLMTDTAAEEAAQVGQAARAERHKPGIELLRRVDDGLGCFGCGRDACLERRPDMGILDDLRDLVHPGRRLNGPVSRSSCLRSVGQNV
jgi:hypothetical protein